MSTAINCAKGNEMPEIWVVIITVILIMIIYAYIASKIKDRKRKKAREKSLPFVEDNVHPGVQYNVFLNDGRKFMAVERRFSR